MTAIAKLCCILFSVLKIPGLLHESYLNRTEFVVMRLSELEMAQDRFHDLKVRFSKLSVRSYGQVNFQKREEGKA